MENQRYRYIENTIDTIPENRALTGRFTTSGTILYGHGTNLRTDLLVGDKVYSRTLGEWSKVIYVNNNGLAYLEDSFPSDITEREQLYILDRGQMSSYFWKNVGTNNGQVDDDDEIVPEQEAEISGTDLTPLVINAENTKFKTYYTMIA